MPLHRQKGYEEQTNLSAIAVMIIENVFRNVFNGRIFACRCPWKIPCSPKQIYDEPSKADWFHPLLAGLPAAWVRGEKRMWVSRSEVYFYKEPKLCHRKYVLLQSMPLGIRGVFYCFRKTVGSLRARPVSPYKAYCCTRCRWLHIFVFAGSK